MNMVERIKGYFAKKRLRKDHSAVRMRQVINLHDARSVAFLYTSTDEATYILVKQFAEKITSHFGTRKTLALAYIPEKEAPSYHTHLLHSDYFTKKDVNWYGYPSCPAVDTFIQEDYDILIDISSGENGPLNYILDRSLARFKVGRTPDGGDYDLIVPTRPGATLDAYLSRIIHILSQINHEKSRIA